MSEKLTETVSFDFIRYANCWEDADILLEGLNPSPGNKILSIASAGDNSFSLLTTNPEMVVAIDINAIQLYLVELKKVCILHLDQPELLAFLGFTPSKDREGVFNKLKSELRSETRQYWEKNLEQIKNGIISQGKFEHYFQLFSSRILPWIHSQKTTEALLETKSEVQQQQFYTDHWNTWRWRLLFKLFFSKYVMGKYGRDPEFLKEVKVPVGQFIFSKAEKHLQSTLAQNNFMLRYNLTGSFGGMLPHYLLPENLEKIRSQLDRLHIVEGYAEDAIKSYGNFHSMNLSNIFEYMNPDLFRKTAMQLSEALETGGRMAYWNLMVPRRISEQLPEKMMFMDKESSELSNRDNGFFYSRFILDKKI